MEHYPGQSRPDHALIDTSLKREVFMEVRNVLKNLDPYLKAEQSEAAQSDKARRKADLKRPDAGDRASVSPEAKLRAEGYSAALSAPARSIFAALAADASIIGSRIVSFTAGASARAMRSLTSARVMRVTCEGST